MATAGSAGSRPGSRKIRLRAASQQVGISQIAAQSLDDFHRSRFARAVGLPADPDPVKRHFPERLEQLDGKLLQVGESDLGLGATCHGYSVIDHGRLRGKRGAAPVHFAPISAQRASHRAAPDLQTQHGSDALPRRFSSVFVSLPMVELSVSAEVGALPASRRLAVTAVCGACRARACPLEQDLRQVRPRRSAVLG